MNVRLAVAICFCYFSSNSGEEPQRQDGPEQIHLSSTGSASSMFVTWVTQRDLGDGVVEFLMGNDPSTVRTAKAVKSPLVHTEDGVNETRTTYIFRATLTGLKPNTKYTYKVSNGNSVESGYFAFKTLEDSDTFKPRVCLFGDLGVVENVSIPNLLSKAERREFDFVIHLGDIAYDLQDNLGRKGDYFDREMQPITATIPYNVLPGNHEAEGNFSEFRGRFTSPGPNVFYNSFNVGPIHFVAFTTEFYIYDEFGTGQIQAQYNWLKKDLETANQKKNRKKQPWIITLGHRPMYCTNFDSWDCRPNNFIRTGYNNTLFNLESLFFKNKVDVQFYGHKHDYERLKPIYRYFYDINQKASLYSDPVFPVHLIIGSAGQQDLDEGGFEQPKADWSVVRTFKFGFHVLTMLDRLTLEFKQFDAKHDTVLDSFLIQKSSDRPVFYDEVERPYEIGY